MKIRIAAISLAAIAVGAIVVPSVLAELVGNHSVRVAVTARLIPRSLPRHGERPVSFTIGGRISSPLRSARPPQLRRIIFAINSNGRLSTRGLPVCRIGHIQPSTSSEALSECGDSLVGHGRFFADVQLPEQSPFPSEGRMLAFNGRVRGRPAVLAHIYGTKPAAVSYVLPFVIQHARGTFGTTLTASLPRITGEWGNITAMTMTLGGSTQKGGGFHTFLSAGCPAPPGVNVASYPLVRASFTFAGNRTLVSTLSRSCRAR
jgi:hypothetical protein